LQCHARKTIPIDGPAKIVETDESKFGKIKYNRGKGSKESGCLGGIEQDSNPLQCFFVSAEDRSAATLIPIMKQRIRPGTQQFSPIIKSYYSLKSEGYLHEIINHSVQFISESGAHTNHIESRWNSFKKSNAVLWHAKKFV